MIGTWYGKPIETLSRKELIKVIRFLVNELDRMKKERKELDDDYWDLLAEKRLGLKV